MNRVFLIGVVATPPLDRGPAREFLLGVPVERGGKAWLERIRVVATGHLADTVRELQPAQSVYADGRLTYARDGAVVEATAVMALADPPASVVASERPTGTHASPSPHDRAGHPRRLHAGTPQERVVWVRPTRVGEPGSRVRRAR